MSHKNAVLNAQQVPQGSRVDLKCNFSEHFKPSLPRLGVVPLLSDSPKADREAGIVTIIILWHFSKRPVARDMWTVQFSVPAFHPSMSLETQTWQTQHLLLSPQQKVCKLRSFVDPLRCLSSILKMQIGSSWEDFCFHEVKSQILSAVASTVN